MFYVFHNYCPISFHKPYIHISNDRTKNTIHPVAQNVYLAEHKIVLVEGDGLAELAEGGVAVPEVAQGARLTHAVLQLPDTEQSINKCSEEDYRARLINYQVGKGKLPIHNYARQY